MKSRARLLLIISLITAIFLSCLTPVSAARSGVKYKVSDDGTYIIITGYDEQFPTLEIESELDGLPVKEIAETAFQNNSYIYNVVIPDTVEKIGEAAFRNCQNLLSVKLPASLKELPFDCFRDCPVLSSLVLPDTLEKIDDFCFQGCTKLSELKIPASVTHIGYDVFMYCESLLLDVSENAYAADYAQRFNVNTDFKGTSLYFFSMMAIGLVGATIVFLILYFLLKKHFEKHPEHNPFVYVGRFFGLIGKLLGKLGDLIKLLISKLGDLIAFIAGKLGHR